MGEEYGPFAWFSAIAVDGVVRMRIECLQVGSDYVATSPQAPGLKRASWCPESAMRDFTVDACAWLDRRMKGGADG